MLSFEFLVLSFKLFKMSDQTQDIRCKTTDHPNEIGKSRHLMGQEKMKNKANIKMGNVLWKLYNIRQ